MNKKIKSICVVTGTRADYGIYYPLLKKLNRHPTFKLSLLVTGMHLSPENGFTFELIKKDKFPIMGIVDTIMVHQNDANMARSIGLGVLGMTQLFETNKPDWVIVLGDRGEMLSAAIAAIHLNIPVAHLHGGERSGSIDESIRHAISKLSHLHFPSTKKNGARLKRMGEDPSRIFVAGSLRVEGMFAEPLKDLEVVLQEYGLPETISSKSYFLFIFHPVTYEWKSVSGQTETILKLLTTKGKPIICILPNTDAGAGEILKCYKKFENDPHFHMVKNFHHQDYLTILKNAHALIGNSSSGIIEAATYQVPVINIGSRQNHRERSLNVIDAAPEKDELNQALAAIEDEEYSKKLKRVKNVYGIGDTSDIIINTIQRTAFTPDFIAKTNSY
ncbi:UDP-N-acetylglucosamine 2-epimerase [Falsibacillus pallidus]|uniref:GDP/UDP-N,N'-diacetylbacillosamine 2-epimerase (Hydrolysing) n=1 Tax=Falsibacillus pallidus TaxID=493781 RepID=A0A370GVM4_9BACI|nr:UDP-N-acetylglucosamine 2-epimerase [Falsibacillus pallidus]RDI47722.1 GDP/UDP-N,N'-diacetylbacillosamine 2-epimerase (hydrolysing) [Falsibacillus pallidus]